MNIPLIHLTYKFDPLQICCRFILNDDKYTNLGFLNLLLSNVLESNLWVAYSFKALMLGDREVWNMPPPKLYSVDISIYTRESPLWWKIMTQVQLRYTHP